MLSQSRMIITLLAVLSLASLGGCTYLAGPHGQVVSLSSYDSVRVESISLGPKADGQDWVLPALSRDLQTRIAASPFWQVPEDEPMPKTATLHVEVTQAQARELRRGEGEDYSLACRLEVRDGQSGESLGSAKLSARANRPGQDNATTATAHLGKKVYDVLTMAKRHSRRRLSCATCK